MDAEKSVKLLENSQASLTLTIDADFIRNFINGAAFRFQEQDTGTVYCLSLYGTGTCLCFKIFTLLSTEVDND